MTAFANHFAFEFKTGLRNPSHLLLNYLFPLGFYVVMGLVMTQINPLFTDAMVPAMIIVAALSSAVLGLPGTLVEAREAGVYRSFKINGVPALSILSIPVVTAMFQVLIVAGIITLTAPLFKGVLPVSWGSFALVTVAMAFCFGGLGALIGVVSSDSRSTVLFSQLIFLPAMLLGGLMVPLDLLPASVRPASALLPATHAMQAYQGLAFGQATVLNPVGSLLVLLSGGILAFGLAIYLFRWDSRNAAGRGHVALGLLALLPFVAAAFLL
jgi:ABC-2 type transport system permease protein